MENDKLLDLIRTLYRALDDLYYVCCREEVGACDLRIRVIKALTAAEAELEHQHN